MLDFTKALGAVDREVVRNEETVTVRMRRVYPAAVEDVWDAITDAERLSRWFLPISGEFKAGGSFQLEGNASGDILRCEPPRLLKVTYGGETSLVEVRLATEGDGTELILEHSVPLEFVGSGVGGLYVGPGWDVAFLGLGLHLDGESVGDPVAWENSPEVQRYSLGSIDAWAAAVKGTATPEEITAGVEAALAQFAPDVRDNQPGNA